MRATTGLEVCTGFAMQKVSPAFSLHVLPHQCLAFEGLSSLMPFCIMQMLEGLQQQLQEASAQRSKAEDYANSIKVSAGMFHNNASPSWLGIASPSWLGIACQLI